MKKKTWLAGLAIAGAAILGSTQSQALSISFDEGAATQTGHVAYDGAGGPLVGIDLIFTSIFGTDTPANSGPGSALFCDCVLNFVTGPNNSEGPLYSWGGGGFFEVFGSVFDGATEIISSDVILSGALSPKNVGISSPGSFSFLGGGKDIKNPVMLDYFGVPLDTDFRFAYSTISLGTCSDFGDPGGFICDVQNQDLQNFSVPVPTPLALLGIGLLGLGASRRKAVI